MTDRNERDYITQDWQSGIMWSESAHADYPMDDGSGDVDVLAMCAAIMPEDATVATSRNYQVLREGDRYTICEMRDGMPVVNDGVCLYYYWSSEDLAQEAADAYNAYEGATWLGQHGYGNDRMTESEADETELSNPDMVRLYRLFGAIDYEEEEEGGDENL